jgi:hypothetical protein
VLQPVLTLRKGGPRRGGEMAGSIEIVLERSFALLLPAPLTALPSVLDRQRSVLIVHGALAPWESGDG